jgi:hypothetical protein
VVPEIKVDNHWQMLTRISRFITDHNQNLAGVTQLAEDPGLIAAGQRSLCCFRLQLAHYGSCRNLRSTDDNYIADDVLFPSPARYAAVLPPGASFTTQPLDTVCHGSGRHHAYEVPYYLQGLSSSRRGRVATW